MIKPIRYQHNICCLKALLYSHCQVGKHSINLYMYIYTIIHVYMIYKKEIIVSI